MLDKNTKVTLGTMSVVTSALVYAGVELHTLKASVWTIEDQQNYVDQARQKNPQFDLPMPLEIRRLRRTEDATVKPPYVGKLP